MHVIGTAGHVDHGKSTLVEALTGIDPDRLKEEREREMTIDLGFAWLKPGEGREEVGIVDVPGHQDFIENMLAGVGGIDLALLVVAADEGVMPQTKEHLSILDILEVQSGVVALTKIDLVEDPEWIELVTLDILDSLSGTCLADSPIIPVSARTGQGLAELQQTILTLLEGTQPRPDMGRPRLPIDRVFTLTGFGTIVTGTLIGGRFTLGESVELQPSGRKSRIRGLQTHQSERQTTFPGSRVAVNLTGIGRSDVSRGDVVAAPGVVSSTILCDTTYRHLPDASSALKHNEQVKLFIGSAEVMARTRVLGMKQIQPGQSGWLQLALSQKTPMVRGDRFVLRRPSPATTLGGGKILDPQPGRQHRRFRPEVITRLETLAHGRPEELLLQAIARLEPTTLEEAEEQSGLEPASAESAREYLVQEQKIKVVGNYIYSQKGWEATSARLKRILGDFHGQYPLRDGIAREELRSRIGLTSSAYNPLVEQLVDDGLLAETGTKVHLPGHEIRLDSRQGAVVDLVMDRLSQAGVNSPGVKEIKSEIGDDLYTAMIDLGLVRQVSNEVFYASGDYALFIGQITSYLEEHGQINAAQVRDMLDTSRKYAIALLEHMDDRRITRRVGDNRVLNI